MDVSVGMLEVARAKHSASGLAAHGIGEPGAPWQRPRNFVQSEVSNVAEFTPESTWDLVCATWAFSYFPDQHAVLDAAYRGLVQGGVCVVHGMSARYARRDSYVLKGDGSYDPTTASKLAWQMRLAGFKHVRVRGFRFLPDNPLFELIPTSLLTRLLQLETEYLPAEWGLTHFAIGVRL